MAAKTVKAFVNHGRLLAACPNCNEQPDVVKSVRVNKRWPVYVEEVTEGGEFVCSHEYPGIRSTAYKPNARGLLVPVPDRYEREQALAQAKKDRRVFKVGLPDNFKAVFAELRKRKRENMNWLQDETLADVKRENKEHGI